MNSLVFFAVINKNNSTEEIMKTKQKLKKREKPTLNWKNALKSRKLLVKCGLCRLGAADKNNIT